MGNFSSVVFLLWIASDSFGKSLSREANSHLIVGCSLTLTRANVLLCTVASINCGFSRTCSPSGCKKLGNTCRSKNITRKTTSQMRACLCAVALLGWDPAWLEGQLWRTAECVYIQSAWLHNHVVHPRPTGS
eukprot:5914703-Amphidinium_carterae.1